ncbi:MAG: peptidase M23 [Acidovorax sp. SCN 68-22]|jgi:murein DD-endopeptidase MepM/ murein hydrolase activator NlpD|nr:M23 family metallopeptidase [Simplicispira sp.]ODS60064.1 MAG: peptidase M23 [Acidovorax sp. SCN 68-22]
MQVIIMDARLARSQALTLSGTRLVLAGMLLSLVLMGVSAGLYHLVFLKGAREGWPVIGDLVRLVAKDDIDQRERFVRQNLDAMARKLGEMQARMVQLESLSDRVSGLAGIPLPATATDQPGRAPGQGGALVASRPLSMQELQRMLDELDEASGQRADLMTVLESRLLDQLLSKHMIPTQAPVPGQVVGSGFGWRIDPLTGRSALHTGLDFPAPTGSDILAAAGGVVVTQEFHPAYGHMVEIDHGNQVITRYAHASRVLVRRGDLVRRGQKIAQVGTSGRSTGPHLHFEVWVQEVLQDPTKFLAAGDAATRAERSSRRAAVGGRAVAGR